MVDDTVSFILSSQTFKDLQLEFTHWVDTSPTPIIVPVHLREENPAIKDWLN